MSTATSTTHSLITTKGDELTLTQKLATAQYLKQKKVSTSAIGIINDILEKNFAITQIETQDFYSFENSLKENLTDIDRTLANIEHIFLVDSGGVRIFEKRKSSSPNGSIQENYEIIAINSEKRPDIIDQQMDRMIGSPLFGLLLLTKLNETLKKKSNQEKKSRIVIIKDFDLLFKNRKEQLNAYHKLESYYDFLATTESKVIILNKEKITTLAQNEVEVDIIKYKYSNRYMKEQLMLDVIEMTKEEAEVTGINRTEGLDLESFLDLTTHLTFCELENIIKDGFESTEELMKHFEQRKLNKIMELNPEIKISKPTMKLEELIGFNNAKTFVTKGMEKGMIKSIILGGVPGSGKTAYANALASHYQIPLIEISLTDSASKYVGESERNAKRIFTALEQIPNAIILMDEVEKQLGSAGSSHAGDSGTGTKVLGELLKFLQNRKPGKNLFIATANNMKTLQSNCPELLRAGRIDTVMYADYPELTEIDELIDLYAGKYQYAGEYPKASRLAQEKWTGAEIDTLFKLAKMLDLDALEVIEQGHITNVSKKYKEHHKDEYMKA